MSLELGYAIVGIFCLVACVIVGVGYMRSGGLTSREPVAIAALAGGVTLASAQNWYPAQTDVLCYVAIGLSVLAAWAAWRDSVAVNATMRRGKSTS